MAGKADEVKGKVKQAAGDLTDNSKLKRDGTADKASGSVKQKVDDLKDKTDHAVDKVTNAIKRH